MNNNNTTSNDAVVIIDYCLDVVKEMAAPPPMFDTWVVVVITVVLLTIPLMAIAGNMVVVIAVKTFPRLQTVTNTYVVSLALADVILAVVAMPIEIYKQTSNKVWMLGKLSCALAHAFCMMMCAVCMYNIVCLTVDRYSAICRPLQYLHASKLSVAASVLGSWILPVFLSYLPLLHGWNERGIEDRIACLLSFADHKACILMVNKPFAVVVSTLAFYLPLFLIVFLNWRMYRKSRRASVTIRASEDTFDPSIIRERKEDTAKMVAIIMGCFAACWLPFFVLSVADPFLGYVVNYNIWCVALWLGYFNAVMNPFLLYTFDKTMRHDFRTLFVQYGICKCLTKSISVSDTVLASKSSKCSKSSRCSKSSKSSKNSKLSHASVVPETTPEDAQISQEVTTPLVPREVTLADDEAKFKSVV